MGSPAGRGAAAPLLLVVVLLVAIAGSPGTGAEAARCGPEPTSLFVQKGEKRTVSFWHHAEPEGSGAELVPAELPAPTAAADPAAPVIVTAGPPDSDSSAPLYVQPPHIVLPEAPPLPVDGGLSADWEPDAELLKQGAAADGSDISTAGAQDGSGSALQDGERAEPFNDPDSLDQIFESFSLAFQGSGNQAEIAAADEDDNTILLDADDKVTLPSGGSDAVSSEGSGYSSAPLPAADAVEGSGAAPETTSENLSVEELVTVRIPESPPAAAAQPSPSEEAAPVPELPSPAADSAAEWDGLEPDELLPLTEISGDLAVSASEPVAVVAPAPAGLSEEERERLLVVKELQDDRVVLEHVPDPEEGSGDGLAVGDDDPAADGSGMSKDEEAPEDRKDVESEIIKAVVDVMNIMTDIHGLVGKDEEKKQAEDPAERIAAFRPSAYRFVDSYAKPNQAAAPVPARPLWSGYHRPGAPPRLPPPPRPLPRPDPVWKHPQHRPGPGHVYFPGQFRRGGPPDGRLPTYRPDERRATYRPPGGGRFAPRVGAPARPLPGYVRRGPSPSGYGQPFKFDAGESLRRKDDHLFRFLRSQPYPFVSALTGSGPEPRGARQPRAAPLDCEWQIETEPHLYLLLTLHNLSAPLTVDCSGAYIEVERENDGFEARWCGDRVRQEGTRPHMVFARGEIRIAVHSNSRGTGLPTGFDAEVEVIDLLDGGQYVKFRRSGLNFRRLIQEPLLPAT